MLPSLAGAVTCRVWSRLCVRPTVLCRPHTLRGHPSDPRRMFATRQTTDTYYSILGVPETASQEDIKVRFYKLSRAYHPDRYATASHDEREKMQDTFAIITDAYETLRSPKLRTKYDNELSRKREKPPPKVYEKKFYQSYEALRQEFYKDTFHKDAGQQQFYKNYKPKHKTKPVNESEQVEGLGKFYVSENPRAPPKHTDLISKTGYNVAFKYFMVYAVIFKVSVVTFLYFLVYH